MFFFAFVGVDVIFISAFSVVITNAHSTEDNVDCEYVNLSFECTSASAGELITSQFNLAENVTLVERSLAKLMHILEHIKFDK